MTPIDPILASLGGIALSALALSVLLHLGAGRLRAGMPTLAGLALAGSWLMALMVPIAVGKAYDETTEIGAGDYALLLTTLSVRPAMAPAFRRAMADGRITHLEMARISAGTPLANRDSMRAVSRSVAGSIR